MRPHAVTLIHLGDYKGIPFAKLQRSTQGQAVRLVLPEALAIIQEPTPTRPFVQLVARRLQRANWNVNPETARDTNKIAGALMRIAPFHPYATPTGERFEAYGRSWARWVWYPSHTRPPALLYRDII